MTDRIATIKGTLATNIKIERPCYLEPNLYSGIELELTERVSRLIGWNIDGIARSRNAPLG